MITLQDFTYQLPPDRIAQEPAHPRDHSKLLVVHRKDQTLQHAHFFELLQFLKPGDVLVLNNSKTVPSRLYGKKESGGQVEVLFVKPIDKDQASETWEVLTKPGLKKGQHLHLPQHLEATCIEVTGYTRKIRVTGYEPSVLETLKKIGHLPLPHYISKELQNEHDYQTVYAKVDGSAATPTAGLHFTPELLESLKQHNITIEEITLHVGLGTFVPVKTDNIAEHVMHSEWFTLSEETAGRLNRAKEEGRRIIAVGTTSMRVLESCSICTESMQPQIKPQTGETSLYVYPPHKFCFVDGLITNFHLPRTTLLMLISAFSSEFEQFSTFATSLAGKAYNEALEYNYRFYSFGDAMFIV